MKIPNERGKSTAAFTALMTRLGMRSGFPDYQLLVPRYPYAGLLIEAKREKGGRLEANQRAWQVNLRRWGYACEVCAGSLEMIACVRAYLAPLMHRNILLDDERTGWSCTVRADTCRFIDRTSIAGAPAWEIGR